MLALLDARPLVIGRAPLTAAEMTQVEDDSNWGGGDAVLRQPGLQYHLPNVIVCINLRGRMGMYSSHSRLPSFSG
jgi:hypothetical protein